MKDLIKKILKEETSSPEIMNTSIEEDENKENIAFIQGLISTRDLPDICYMDVIYDGYNNEYRVEITMKGGINQWYSTNMSDEMGEIETQAQDMKGIKVNMFMPRFIDNCGELDPGIQRVNESEEDPTNKILTFLRRRYEVNEVNIGDNINFKNINFKVGDDYYGFSTWDSKKKQVRTILNMLEENNIIDPLNFQIQELNPYNQKVVKAVKQFLSSVI